MTANNTERLHALDAARGFVLLLGIVFHATVSFLPAPPGVPVWIVMDNQRSFALAVLFYVTHIFRMTTFFVIAGFFAHMSFHKKGTRAFIRDRLKRIGIPLVVGWPTLFALIVAATIWGHYMHSVAEFYGLAIVIGLIQGGVQSLSRSLYAHIIPASRAAEFFGFYNMLGKFAAILGPLLMGFAAIATGSSRAAILAVVVLFAAGAIVLMFVDENEGARVARELER